MHEGEVSGADRAHTDGATVDVLARLAAVHIDIDRFGSCSCSTLSAGQKFQVGLARVLKGDTVVVDEFTSCLDRPTVSVMMSSAFN